MTPGHRRRIVFVTQTLDPSDPVLGFVPDWLRALAEQFDEVVAVANRVPVALPPRPAVFSLGREAGRGRVRRALELVRIVRKLTADSTPTLVLVHMIPVYAVLAKLGCGRAPLALWFAHPAISPSLRAAERASDAIVTSLPGAFPLKSAKVRVIGQATAVEGAPTSMPPSPPLRLIAVGRTSPAKGFITIIDAVEELTRRGVAARLLIVGPSTTRREQQHREELRQRIEQLSPGLVKLRGPVSRAAVGLLLEESHILTNAMVSGSGDKVVFEAIARGRIPVVSNSSFRDLLSGLEVDLLFPPGDACALADAIERLAALPLDHLESIAAALTARVRVGHSLETWACHISRLADDLLRLRDV